MSSTPTNSPCYTTRQVQLRQRNSALSRRLLEEASSDEPSEVETHLLVVDRHGRDLSRVFEERDRVGVVQLGRLGARRQVVEDEMEEGEEGVVLGGKDVLLE